MTFIHPAMSVNALFDVAGPPRRMRTPVKRCVFVMAALPGGNTGIASHFVVSVFARDDLASSWRNDQTFGFNMMHPVKSNV